MFVSCSKLSSFLTTRIAAGVVYIFAGVCLVVCLSYCMRKASAENLFPYVNHLTLTANSLARWQHDMRMLRLWFKRSHIYRHFAKCNLIVIIVQRISFLCYIYVKINEVLLQEMLPFRLLCRLLQCFSYRCLNEGKIIVNLRYRGHFFDTLFLE